SDAGSRTKACPSLRRRLSVRRREWHRQALHPAQRERVNPLEPLRRQLQPGEPGEDAREGDLRLEPCQRRAETEVGAVAESQMAVVVALNIEAVGIGEAARVAVGGVHEGVDAVALGELASAELLRA